MRSIVSLTARSLPGIGVALKMTVSPARSCTFGMVAVGHPAQSRQRLALGAGRDHDHLVVGEVLDLLDADEHPLGHLDVAEPAADVDVLAHRAADQRDLAAERLGGVDDLLDAVDVRREAGDDDAALAAPERLLELGPDARLGRRPAGAVGVGRVAAEEQNALAAELGKPPDVGGLAVDRRLVELVVAREQDGAELAGDRTGEHVRDRVGELDRLDVERAGVDVVAGRHDLERDVLAACARRASTAPCRSSARRRRRAGGRRGCAAGTAAPRRGPRGRA